MTITLVEAITGILSGQKLTWEASGSFKSSSIHLKTSGARRLAKFLIDSDSELVEDGDNSLFSGLHEAWEDIDSDTVEDNSSPISTSTSGPWRLSKIEAKGFGGLTTPNGPAFEMEVNEENWCLEGYNGSGKTSLVNLILWTLTGYRNREQLGPEIERGFREPVTDNSGKKIGTWPPIVTYPNNTASLNDVAKVSATLTFVAPNGDVAVARRGIESPFHGEPQLSDDVDPRLLSSPELIETGLLMPARIAHIGFGDKSQKLHQALKMLTGLDQLSSIATGVATLTHGGRRFLKYAKDNNAESFEREYNHNYSIAIGLAENTNISLPENLNLNQSTLVETLIPLQTQSSELAGKTLELLTNEIPPSFNLNEVQTREILKNAVNKARFILGSGKKDIEFFEAMGALENAAEDNDFKSIEKMLINAEADLEVALEWHFKQQNDEKLRLKAIASKFFIPVKSLEEVANCPLCETKLDSAKQKLLAQELEELKINSEKASRSLNDACRDITSSFVSIIPEDLQRWIKMLSEVKFRDDFKHVLESHYSSKPPFSDILLGVPKFLTTFVDSNIEMLPTISLDLSCLETSGLQSVDTLRSRILRVRNVSQLSKWWEKNKKVYDDVWNNFLGVADENSNWPENSLEGKMLALETAIKNSEPLDQLAKVLMKTIKAAQSWGEINKVQRVRENIAEALKPLKELQSLVNCETHRTVETLSGRVQNIVSEIQLNERLSYSKAEMTKKTVSVKGRFVDGLDIDAGLVANSSWMRALLWAFIFALREHTIDELGFNNFPLVLLDDPQTTFDQKNKRKWAEKIVHLANSDLDDKQGIQLFLTTHERQFFDIISTTYDLSGQQGNIAGPTPMSKVAHVINGTRLRRMFEKVSNSKDDEQSFLYIQQVRVHCEDLLKIMLRPHTYQITGETLGAYCNLLKSLRNDHVSPYNQRPFAKLIQILDEQSHHQIKHVNATHHAYDQSIGYAQAVDVEKYWREKIERIFMNAFRLTADFDAFGSPSRLFSWEENIIEFPKGFTTELTSINLAKSTVSAVATSDGLVGDGQIEFETSENASSFKFVNHKAYMLNSGTIEPVATIGDILIVSGFIEPRSKNLVAAVVGDKLYARRVNESEEHADVVVLTGQATDPYAVPEPVIAVKSKVLMQKIVGTIFRPTILPIPNITENELIEIDDFSLVEDCCKDLQIITVKGRSMEPIALDGQFVMTKDEVLNEGTLSKLDNNLVIATDQDGAVYFKRLRKHGKLVVLESANSTNSTSSEILSLSEHADYKTLTGLKAVVGVLFEAPS